MSIITTMRSSLNLEKLVKHVNRKEWWHVPPRDLSAYSKRGKFFASSFREAEFWGRPLDEPQKVTIEKPLVGDDEAIERKLLGRRLSSEDITMEDRWALDAKLKRAGIAKGFDSIVLIASKAFAEFQSTGKLPRSMELNVLNVGSVGESARRRRPAR
jgi:hypothetical protein